ncbi:hypothetical protein WMY93_024957 [Mugilogobius chulae]|uniref:TM2 domain-containing protein n=1 Tax=Mugilogobius chulae TaxID=88201 RepID=A0AAW0N5H0_9GOBI
MASCWSRWLRSSLWSLFFYGVYSHLRLVLADEAENLECLPAPNVTCRLNVSGYSYKVAVALSLFLGWLGADRFYLGYPALGLLKFCTVGFCGIGTLIDFILIAMQIVGPADGSLYIVDYYGARLTRLSITNETYRKPHLSLIRSKPGLKQLLHDVSAGSHSPVSESVLFFCDDVVFLNLQLDEPVFSSSSIETVYEDESKLTEPGVCLLSV